MHHVLRGSLLAVGACNQRLKSTRAAVGLIKRRLERGPEFPRGLPAAIPIFRQRPAPEFEAWLESVGRPGGFGPDAIPARLAPRLAGLA